MPGTIGVITWAALLARWTEFARSALSLPTDGEGGRWRRAVPDVIALQAIVHALGEIDSLVDQRERPAAIDVAEVQVHRHAGSVHDLWRGERLPLQLVELVEDARLAIRVARSAGFEWIVAREQLLCDHPAELVGTLLDADFAGDLYLPTPGVPLFPGCPAAFVRGPAGTPPESVQLRAIGDFLDGAGESRRAPCLRQVYRQFDFGKGRAVRDLVVGEFDDLPGGQPLLVHAIIGGEARAVTLPIRGAADQERLPLVHARSENAG